MLVVDAYDAPSVVRTIEDDIAQHGAPLVWRMDRARAHHSADHAPRHREGAHRQRLSTP
jgi:hypothetical protein